MTAIDELRKSIDQIFKTGVFYEHIKEMGAVNDSIATFEGTKDTLRELRVMLDNDYLPDLCKEGADLFVLIAFLQLRVLLDPCPEMFEDMLVCIDSDQLSKEARYYLWAQCRNMKFNMPSINSDKAYDIWMRIYKGILEDYRQVMTTSLERIPLNERDHKSVVFITSQFVQIQHGPTKSCFYRAKVLSEDGRDVLIINTNDLMPASGKIPLFRAYRHGSIPEYERFSTVSDDEVSMSFFQCGQDMPRADVIDVLLQNIREIRPKFIVSIGGFNITASLANKMVPTLCIGMGPSQMEYDYSDFFTYSMRLTEDVYTRLSKFGGTRMSLIPSVFTSDLKVQSEHHTREEYGIPNDKAVVCVVGGRLEVEVDDEFIYCMKQCIDDNMIVAFIGKLNKYRQICEKDNWFKEHTVCIGYVEDILSHIELCDIYLNPRRLGGGTSCVEAMSKGCVPVSLNFGDVAYNIGEDFIVEDYKEMADRLNKLACDKEYYKIMSERALKRAEYLCDTKNRFMDTIHELESRL
ncbi:glycosyltransferase [Butyrivibrio sp. VCD2006]|uniref:glycosyltransferase n=1 Tax=Butyrivibrio sp. VCD2006 TaxID=1280664 RepID=UPI000404B15E|nr:glycosyltransferase [Butyrivibrio sp. VCD2006]